ncbi:putative ribonuclease H-like domain-containing protein [Tanacetum coccineum]
MDMCILHLSMMKAGLKQCKKSCFSSRFRRNKKDERGIVVKNKSRLVAQGYKQEEGIDYDEMDVKSTFLYGTMEEECIYAKPPLRFFVDLEFPEKVYKVEKALYGLHQAPRACTPKENHKAITRDKKVRMYDGRRLYIFQVSGQKNFTLKAVENDLYIPYKVPNLDMKSTTRGCQFLGSRLISWQCKKQTVQEFVILHACLSTVLMGGEDVNIGLMLDMFGDAFFRCS